MFNKNKGIKQNESYIEVKNLPILILDSDWFKSFPKENQTREMTEAENELKELLKEQGRLNEQIKKLSANKKSILSKMLTQSNDVVEKPSKAAKEKLDLSRTSVEKINEALEKSKAQADLTAEKIESTNNRLFQLGVREAYNIMSKNFGRVRKHEETIDKLRAKIAEETAKKERLEEQFKSSMDFLTEYIGEEGIKQLDEKYKGRI